MRSKWTLDLATRGLVPARGEERRNQNPVQGGARSGVDDGLGHTLGPIPPIKPKGSSRSRRTIKAILKFSRRHSRVLSWLRLVNDIEQNPGPAGETRKEQRRKGREERQTRRNQKWVDRATMKGKRKATIIWTWNIQRARVTFPRKNRFAEILKEATKREVEVILFTELHEETEGLQRIKSGDLYGVLVHGKKSGIFLRDVWATNWKDQGYRRKHGERSTSVDVDGVKFVAAYQPLWNADPVEFASYREELNEQILGCDRHIKLIIGGDWNFSIGDTNRRTQDKMAGAYGLGNTNAAGNDLIIWCHEHELAWTNSFFRHKKRGSWKCPARKSWHEIDGFMTRQNQRSRLVKNVRTETTSRTLSDHKPKMMECSQVTRAIETAEGLVERTEKILARKTYEKSIRRRRKDGGTTGGLISWKKSKKPNKEETQEKCTKP